MSVDPTVLPQRARRSRWTVFLPVIVFIGLAIVWSIAWLVISKGVNAQVETAIAKAAEDGRKIACQDRSVGGYPFRIELRCSSLSVDVETEAEAMSVSAGKVVVVSQVYNPAHIIAEVDGPVILSRPDDPRRLEFAYANASASVVFGRDAPRRASLVINDLVVTGIDGEMREPLLDKALVEAHLRQSEGANAGNGNYDIALLLNAAGLPPLDERVGAAAIKAQTQAVVRGWTDWSERPFKERLKDWAAAGGTSTIVLSRVERGEVAAEISGDVAIESAGTPSGKFSLRLAGTQALGKLLSDSGLAPPQTAQLVGLAAGALGKPSNIDGREAVELPLTLAGGRASLGAFPIGPTPKLF